MTKIQAKEAIEVLNAYCEGKEIEVADTGIGNWGNVVSDEPRFNFASFDYRIKPTEEYRPYKDTDEMIEDFASRFHQLSLYSCDLPLIWVKRKNTNCKELILGFYNNEVEFSTYCIDMKELFNDYEYLDGTKIGKKEE